MVAVSYQNTMTDCDDSDVTSIGTISIQDIENTSMIQKFLPNLKIQDVKVVDGYWEALVTLRYPCDGSCTKWIKVKDLIDNFKGDL